MFDMCMQPLAKPKLSESCPLFEWLLALKEGNCYRLAGWDPNSIIIADKCFTVKHSNFKPLSVTAC